MTDPVLLSTFTDVFWAVLVTMFIFIPLVLIWTFALADLFTRRDIRWGKVWWLLLIVFLPLFGPIIYLLVRPEEADVPPPNPPAAPA
jgi:hypothetical protein